MNRPTEPTEPSLTNLPTPVMSAACDEATIEFVPGPELLCPDRKRQSMFGQTAHPQERSPIFFRVTPVEPMSIAVRYVEQPTPAPTTDRMAQSSTPTLVDANPHPFSTETTTETRIATITEPLLPALTGSGELLTVETSAPSWSELEARLAPPAPPAPPAPQPLVTSSAAVFSRSAPVVPSWTPDSEPGVFPRSWTPAASAKALNAPAAPAVPDRGRRAFKPAPGGQVWPVAVATFATLSASAFFSWLWLGSW